MILAITILLCCQLLGEGAARALGLPLPGPVIGMALLLAALLIFPRLAEQIRPTTQGLLAHLSLLFVPAGVGVVGHLATFGTDGGAILLALVVSTIAAIAVSAAVFIAVARLLGGRDA